MGRPKKNRRKTPEEKEINGGNVLTKASVAMNYSVCKMADHNKKGHAKYMEDVANGRIQATDANGDVDNPTILHHIIHQPTMPEMDPSNQPHMMVHIMSEEVHVKCITVFCLYSCFFVNCITVFCLLSR